MSPEVTPEVKPTNTGEINIEHLGLMGQGVGYDSQGNIYFVPGALPGDKVKVDYQISPKKYRDAKLIKILEPSPHRKDPRCPNFGICGGCDWLDLAYAEQVKHKEAILKHAVERSPFTPNEVLPFVASPTIYGYRSRIQLKRSNDRLGFYRRRSHDLIPIEQCLVAEPRLNEEIQVLKNETKKRSYSTVELCVDDAGVVSRSFDSPHGASGFTQVNRLQNENLKATVADRIKRAGALRVLELFCGDGNLTFAYASLVAHTVVGIDANAQAIARANSEATAGAEKNSSRGTISFLASGVGPSLLKKLPALFDGPYDTLVLDPPRSGAGGSLEFFVQPFVKNVIYISCSVLTFSTDIRSLKKAGFVLEDIQGLDMFPHTRHIELVARFRR